MLSFSEFSLCKTCSLYSIYMDGQKVFIVLFESEKDREVFDKTFDEIHPTLLGCIDTTQVKLKEETVDSMLAYTKSFKRKANIQAANYEMLSSRSRRYPIGHRTA